MSESKFQPEMPPASFELLVASLRVQAEIQLGLLHFGEEKDRPEPNLPLARHAIDMLGVLSEKTKGNLSWPEQRDLDNSLAELRLRYVQVSQRAPKPSPEVEGASGAAAGSGE